MNFYFDNEGDYVEALEYLLRLNVGFSHSNTTRRVTINPIEHDQLPIYDECIVARLDSIGEHSDTADELLAKELNHNNVAG